MSRPFRSKSPACKPKAGEALQRAGFSKDLAPVLKAEKEEEIDEAIEVLKQSGIKSDEALSETTASKQAALKETQPTAPEQLQREQMPSWARALNEKLEALSEARQGELKRTQAQTLLSKSSLPDHLKEKWIGRIELQGAGTIEDQVKALEGEYAEIEQSLVSKASASGLPLGGSSPQISEGQVENIIASL